MRECQKSALVFLVAAALLFAVQCSDSSSGKNTNADASVLADGTTDGPVEVTDGTVDAVPTDSFIVGPGCLPDQIHGDLLLQDDGTGYTLYEGCESNYLWERPGTSLATGDDLSDLMDQHGADLLNIPGVTGAGRGFCCPAASPEQCIHLSLQTHTTRIVDLASALEDVVSPSDLCMGFVVNLIGYTDPRCEETDPDCLPIPMCAEVTDPTCCPTAPTYEPTGQRYPSHDTLPALDFLSEGGCTYDGECVLNGCGQYCNAYTEPGFFSTCECYPDLAEAFCGCVDQQCQWFFQ